jgi:hypothetical protein
VCHFFCECQFCTSKVKTKVIHLISPFRHMKITQVLQGLEIWKTKMVWIIIF